MNDNNRTICPRCGMWGWRSLGSCPDCDEDADSYPPMPPLVAGGQGRSANEVSDSASWLTWLALVCIAGLAVAKVLAP
jgi:hypothetical protein